MRNNWKTLENQIRMDLESLSLRNSDKEIEKIVKDFNTYAYKIKEELNLTGMDTLRTFTFKIPLWYYNQMNRLIHQEKRYASLAEILRIAIRDFIKLEIAPEEFQSLRSGEIESEG